jgi:hypothetical protein
MMGSYLYKKDNDHKAKKENQQDDGNQPPFSLYYPSVKIGSLNFNKQTRGEIGKKQKKNGNKVTCAPRIAVTSTSATLVRAITGLSRRLMGVPCTMGTQNLSNIGRDSSLTPTK